MVRYILAVLIAYLSFTLVFKVLDESVLGLFAPIQKYTNRRKWKSWTFILMIFIWVILKEYFQLGNIGGGFLIGGLMSLREICIKPYSGDQ